MSKRIKSVTVRFNKEVAPFQHVRVEVGATITKEDDAEQVKDEVIAYCHKVVSDLEQVIFKPPPEQSAENLTPLPQTAEGPF